MGVGTLGNTYIDAMLGEYIPVGQTNTPMEELLTDESDQLLYALLVEMRAARFSRGQYDIQGAMQRSETDSVDTEGTYVSRSVDVPELNSSDDWEPLDLDFVTGEVDLRFDSDIQVAFVKDPGDGDVVPYSVSDSPVVGIPVETSWIWVVAQSGSGGATVQIDAWGSN